MAQSIRNLTFDDVQDGKRKAIDEATIKYLEHIVRVLRERIDDIVRIGHEGEPVRVVDQDGRPIVLKAMFPEDLGEDA
ncbi:MAG: hypothetical protein ACE37E_01145 [Hyphomicrobiales bacterium]